MFRVKKPNLLIKLKRFTGNHFVMKSFGFAFINLNISIGIITQFIQLIQLKPTVRTRLFHIKIKSFNSPEGMVF